MAPLRALAALLDSRSPSSSAELRRGGREVGYALVRRDAVVVETLRDTIDAAERGADDDPFARGYRAALADTVSGFAAALDAWLEVEHAASALGRREVQVLRALEGEARPQVRIARELSMAPHDVSRAAKRLRATGLVAAYAGARETEQLHRMTALGRAVVRELDARAARDAAFAGGTPPTGETPLFAEEPPWSPAPPPADAPPPAAARAARPVPRTSSRSDVHELDTARDRWNAHAADEDE
jgi:DNA-binding MarR family transcriptional regulator